MLVKAFGSHREININVSRYRIDWNRKVSKPQFKFKKFIYPYWKYDVVLEEFVIPKSGGKRIDLFNISKGIAVEISPASVHFEYNKFFHGSRSGYEKKIISDWDKIKWVESNGWKIVEILDEDLADENLNMEYLVKKYGIKF